MASRRWIAPWKDSREKPVFYHCISRVVDKRFAFAPQDKEKFRMFLRMYESYSGCRVLTYCLMCNHVHILLEVPPPPEGGISDAELLERLRAVYKPAVVAEFAGELAAARKKQAAWLAGAAGEAGEARVEAHVDARVEAIRARHTYRMHDLSEFMKSVVQRFTKWYNREHERAGNLWEDAFKSVLVEDGYAARTMAAYIDLNPVRAGIVSDPADYRWSGYGEASGGGAAGGGRKARAGLVRALTAHKGGAADARRWAGEVSETYRMMLLEAGVEKTEEVVEKGGERAVRTVRKGMAREAADAEMARLERGGGVAAGKMLRCRVRYFTEGVAIGGRGFVDGVFQAMRGRFGPKRKDGARRMRGTAGAAAGVLWSLRDLRKGVG